ncbi:MAG: carbohydrate ABC transporter permease [bacterium]
MALDIEKQKETRAKTLITDLDVKKPSLKILYFSIYLFVFIVGFIQLVPLIWMVSGSLQSVTEIGKVPPTLIPKTLKWCNYTKILVDFNFFQFLINTIIFCVINIFLQLSVVPLAAYALSKLRPPFANTILLIFLSTMMIPNELRMIPSYLIMKQFPFANIPFTNIQLPYLNFINTYWALILPCASVYNLLLYKSFFDQLPEDLLNAARIDGCSETRIFLTLVMPLSKPVLAVIGIFTFMGTWGSYLPALIYLESESKQPIALAIANQVRNISSLGWNELMALSVLISIPMFIYFLFTQKYILRGITFTGFKW